MGAPQIKNPNVVRAINALTAYRNVLILMAQSEKDYADQLSLKFMMELNSRLINFLNTIAESEISIDQLPTTLQVKPENIKEFFIKLNKEISSSNSKLARFSESQRTRWENFFDALLEIPEDMLEPLAVGLLVTGFEFFVASMGVIATAILMWAPELILPSLAILFPTFLTIGVATSVVTALVIALCDLYNKIAPSYEQDGFTALSNEQLLALDELISLTQDEFQTTIPNTPFKEVTITEKASSVGQAFFANRKKSDSTLADEAVNRYETVRSNMYI